MGASLCHLACSDNNHSPRSQQHQARFNHVRNVWKYLRPVRTMGQGAYGTVFAVRALPHKSGLLTREGTVRIKRKIWG